KWPNHLWVDARKLGGILVETAGFSEGAAAARHAVIGVGLNVGPREAGGLATPPAWLQELDPGLDAPAALLRVAEPLVASVQAFAQFGFGPFQACFEARDALRD